MQEYIGEFSALLVAVFWTVTALAFERASLRIGSLSLNVIRLFIGLFFLSIFVWIRTGMPFPAGATQFNWIWLTVSGLVGFVFGDLFLFKSYSMIGSRFAMLIMTLAPPMTAITGWIAAIIGFAILTTWLGRWKNIFTALRQRSCPSYPS